MTRSARRIYWNLSRPAWAGPIVVALMMLLVAPGAVAAADALSPDEVEFFESRIRPVLAEHCYQCHNSVEEAKAGLKLDHRAGMFAGGERGAAIVPGNPAGSLLLTAIRHDRDDLRMPKAGPKLSDAVIADFTRWIEMGAPDPRSAPPTGEELAAATDWGTIFQRRKAWWSLQPIEQPDPPHVAKPDWSAHPVDRFILAKLESADLAPAPPADRTDLLRRVTFVLTGLPPTPQEVEAFLSDQSADAYEKVVDRLLASPRFGERWARHWMDWFRYAETHGSEGDPTIPHAWRYRDYLIRALNGDVPYDQLVREQIAGDLLPQPRINTERRINESAIGPAQYRFVQHGYAPVDPLDEQVRFTDNQIDVLSKALMGMTVSCARCHNHKFDAISQADFYALYGIMASARPATTTIDTPAVANLHRERLTGLKKQIKQGLADTWRAALADWPSRMLAAPRPTPPPPEDKAKKKGKKKDKDQPPPDPWQVAIDRAAKDAHDPLHAWIALRDLDRDAFNTKWNELRDVWRDQLQYESRRAQPRWDVNKGGLSDWHPYGAGLDQDQLANSKPAGAFHVLPEGDRVVTGIYPAGVFTHLLSSKHNGVLTSPRFKVETSHVSVRALGTGGVQLRMVVRNYPRIAGPIYGQRSTPSDDTMRWHHWNATYWKGETVYLEAATAADLPVRAAGENRRSWFGLAEVVFHNGGDEQPRDLGAPLQAIATDSSPASPDELAQLYADNLRACIDAWEDGTLSDAQAMFLDRFVRSGLLPNALTELSNVAPLVETYRQLENEIAFPTRVPGVVEGEGYDQPLFVRGNHKQPDEPVTRRFLEAFGDEPYEPNGSGRLQLAQDIASADNPLTARVIVNRLWHHVFGRGLVATPDNFGALGEKPTHPQLLDYLASRFIEEGWSIKRALRLLVSSRTFRMSSAASPAAQRSDPANTLWSHMEVRRLEAEAIRDAILASSGALDTTMYGPGVAGKAPRRSVYLAVRRNSLDPLLVAFDYPEPATTRGRRAATNVPAQSLTLLNDPLIIDLASQWAQTLVADGPSHIDERLKAMFLKALGRPMGDAELALARAYLTDLAAAYELAPDAMLDDPRPWRDMAQSIFNLKAFIYLR